MTAIPDRRAASASVYWVLLLLLVVALGMATIAAVSIGAVRIPFEHVVGIVSSGLWPVPRDTAWTATEAHIVWEFRLPRVLLAIIVGAALSVSGAALQAVARNPLADPYVFGVSYGASVGAVLVLTTGVAVTGGVTLSTAAFLGALLAMVAVYLLAQKNGQVTSLRLVLSGVALSYVLSAFTSYLLLRSAEPGNSGVTAVLNWLAGTLGGARWDYLGLPALTLIVVVTLLLLQARALNALLAGEETAISLGIDVARFRLFLFGLTSLLVGVVVAVSGAIGFVGLMIPHICRLLVGADHRRVLPLAALLGGLFLVLVDIVARMALAPQELPVGIVTAFFGGPFFLWLMRQRMQGGGA